MTPHAGERRSAEELVQPDRAGRRARRQPQQEPRGQARAPGGGVGARREQHQTIAGRLADEGEEQLRLRVALLGQRQADRERLRDGAPSGVAEDGVRTPAHGKAALREAREHHSGEAETAQFERREHGDALSTDAAARYARAGEQLAQRDDRGADVDLAA